MIRHVVASALVLSAVSLPRVTAAGDSDAEYKNAARALGNGEFGVTLRYRYEQVAEDGFSDDAYASTLRTTLGYRSAGFYRLQAQLQFEDVSNLGLADDHNDTA
ncbi:MAG TPA: hypothetical protein VD788_15525, partial [Candidatus Polarisedimenticolaceae bacterium]|nr:hypothetical protein [Candidatus Polarisedimenticolaceae bacterium]